MEQRSTQPRGEHKGKKLKMGEVKDENGKSLTEDAKNKKLQELDDQKDALKRKDLDAKEAAIVERSRISVRGSLTASKLATVKMAWDSAFYEARSAGPAGPPLKIGKFNKVSSPGCR